MPIIRRLAKGINLTWAELDGNFDAVDLLAPRILTIMGGMIEVNGPGTYRLAPESGTSDVLTTINGGIGHEEPIELCLNTAGHTITIVHTPPNLNMAPPGDFILNGKHDSIEFKCCEINEWRETRRISLPA